MKAATPLILVDAHMPEMDGFELTEKILAIPEFRYVKLWNREIHTGDIGGLPTRILACLASLMLPVMAVTGPLIWWNRWRQHRSL